MHIEKGMQECINTAKDCSDICQQTIRHCLQMGGKHAELKHITTMIDCAEMCTLAANFMSRGSDDHGKICGMCADICESCASDCAGFNEEFMKKCADICSQCAELCRKMSGTQGEMGTQKSMAEI